jgi:hypothetical protein
MEFIAGGTNYAAQVKAAVQQGRGLAFGAFVSFFFADEEFNLMSEETADRGGTASSDDFGLLNGLAVEADGQILFLVGVCVGHKSITATRHTCSTYSTCIIFLVASQLRNCWRVRGSLAAQQLVAQRQEKRQEGKGITQRR